MKWNRNDWWFWCKGSKKQGDKAAHDRRVEDERLVEWSVRVQVVSMIYWWLGHVRQCRFPPKDKYEASDPYQCEGPIVGGNVGLILTGSCAAG